MCGKKPCLLGEPATCHLSTTLKAAGSSWETHGINHGRADVLWKQEDRNIFLPHPGTPPPLPPSAEMCFDQDPPDTVFLLNAGVEEPQKFEAKV